jgi:hypothetical protein
MYAQEHVAIFSWRFRNNMSHCNVDSLKRQQYRGRNSNYHNVTTTMILVISTSTTKAGGIISTISRTTIVTT